MFRDFVIYSACTAFALFTTTSRAQQSAQVPAKEQSPESHPIKPSASRAGLRDDPVAVDSEKAVSLEWILEHAMKHAPAITVGRARIVSGQAEVEAASPLLPSDPILSGSVGRRQTGARSGVDYSVAVQQELDLSGRRGTQLRAARSDLSARQAELVAEKWFVRQQVHAAFRQALVAREREQAAARVLVFAERLVSVAKQRLAAGETSPLPVRLAEAELAQAKQAAMLAAYAYDRIRLELAQVAGWTKPALPTPTGFLDSPQPPPAEAVLFRLAQSQEPALRAARARVVAAQAGLAAARRRAWPNPTVGILYENEAGAGTEAARILSGTLSIPLPLWVGSTPDRARARAALEQARAEQVALGRTLGPRIAQARERVSVHANRARLYGTEILPTLETNLELLRKAFELGEIDLLDVMVAQEHFLRTQQEALQSFADYYDAWAELEGVVGVTLEPGSDRGRALPKPRGTEP
jgi:cobalt-zinc-cadmium efflux system outer membrane protein